MSQDEEAAQPQHKVIWKGHRVTIWAINSGGQYPADDFVNHTISDGDKTKLLAIFTMLDSQLGAFRNPQKIKKLLEYDNMTFMEFKSHQVRIGWFWQPKYQLFATHGFIKKADDWPTGQIETMKNIYSAWKNLEKKEDTDERKKTKK